MKLSLKLTILLANFSCLCFGQEAVQNNSNTRSLNSDSKKILVIQKDSISPIQKVPTQNTSNQSKEWTVESLDYYIMSLEKKRDWVRTNPEEDAKAKASGWYDEIEGFLNAARKRKEKLVKHKQ